MTRAIGNGSGGTSISQLAARQGRGWNELDLRGPVAIFPEIGMCPLLSSEYSVTGPNHTSEGAITPRD